MPGFTYDAHRRPSGPKGSGARGGRSSASATGENHRTLDEVLAEVRNLSSLLEFLPGCEFSVLWITLKLEDATVLSAALGFD